jgi:hypothetical protein
MLSGKPGELGKENEEWLKKFSNSYNALFYGILDKFCAGTHSQFFHNSILMKFHCSWGDTKDVRHLFG